MKFTSDYFKVNSVTVNDAQIFAANREKEVSYIINCNSRRICYCDDSQHRVKCFFSKYQPDPVFSCWLAVSANLSWNWWAFFGELCLLSFPRETILLSLNYIYTFSKWKVSVFVYEFLKRKNQGNDEMTSSFWWETTSGPSQIVFFFCFVLFLMEKIIEAIRFILSQFSTWSMKWTVSFLHSTLLRQMSICQ